MRTITLVLLSILIAACAARQRAPTPGRSQILTGTHFPNTICLTEAQVKASDHGKQEALDQLGKAGGSDCRIYKCN